MLTPVLAGSCGSFSVLPTLPCPGRAGMKPRELAGGSSPSPGAKPRPN